MGYDNIESMRIFFQTLNKSLGAENALFTQPLSKRKAYYCATDANKIIRRIEQNAGNLRHIP